MRPAAIPAIPRTRAVPTIHLRAAGSGLAAMQGVLGSGVWLFMPDGSPVRAWAIGVNAAASVAAVLVFLAALRRAGPVARREAGALWALAAVQIAACPAAVLGARPDLANPADPADPALLVIATAAMLVIALVPVLAGLTQRIGTGDLDWSPHEADALARAGAIVWATVLFGAWTASVGVGINTFVIPLRMPSQTFDLRQTVALMTLSHAMGMAAGLCGSALTVYLLRHTHLQRTLPRVFLPTMGAGVAACAVLPPLGIFVSGVTMTLTALLARHRWPRIPPGCCQSCGYDLTGATAPVCPECGRPVASAARTDPL